MMPTAFDTTVRILILLLIVAIVNCILYCISPYPQRIKRWYYSMPLVGGFLAFFIEWRKHD